MPSFRLGLFAFSLLFAIPGASAQTGGWQVNEGPSARHSFGRVIPNGDNEGFLSGAEIPAANAAGWSAAAGWPGATNPGALQWNGTGGTPCRSQANYTYFQATVTPEPGRGYEVEFMNADDAARVSVTAGTGTINIPDFIGLRERKTMDLTPFLEPGMANRVVITLADVCGGGTGIRAELRARPGGSAMDDVPTLVAQPAPAAVAAAAGNACTPEPGWSQCLSVGSPDIRINGTRNVSASAMRVVAAIYGDIAGRLRPAYPASRFDGFRVYMTNGETAQQLNALPQIAEFGPDASGNNSKDFLRGGTGGRHLWISEQMICKTGVATRGPSDTATRTFDQVVHEFVHAIDNTYSLRPRILGMYTAAENRAFPSPERFPWAVQHYLSTPAGTLSAGEQRLMNDLFTGPTTYSCTNYRP